MGGLGCPHSKPGYHSPNIGGSVSSKRSITAANPSANRCLRLFVLLFRTRNYLEILACVLPFLQGATIGGALGHPGPTDVRVHGTSDKPTSAARIVYSLKIAEAGSEPSSTIFITWWSLAERWKTDVPFDSWYGTQMRKAFGFDVARLPRAASGELLFAWHDDDARDECEASKSP